MKLHLSLLIAAPFSFAVLLPRAQIESYSVCAKGCESAEATNEATRCSAALGLKALASCVCKDSIGLTIFAQCVYETCGESDLEATAPEVEYNCNLNGSPAVLNAQQFLAAGQSASTAGVAPTGTGTTGPSSTSSTGGTPKKNGSPGGGGEPGQMSLVVNIAALIVSVVMAALLHT